MTMIYHAWFLNIHLVQKKKTELRINLKLDNSVKFVVRLDV